MAMTQIPNINYEIAGDTISLEQDAGCGEVHSISLHRIHFDHIASKLGLPVLSVTAETIKRRLEAINSRINTLADFKDYREEIINNCRCGVEFITELDVACELATEFLNDISSSTIKTTEGALNE